MIHIAHRNFMAIFSRSLAHDMRNELWCVCVVDGLRELTNLHDSNHSEMHNSFLATETMRFTLSFRSLSLVLAQKMS
jgi:hypothetical protein